MRMPTIPIFTDRDGDTLSVVCRDRTEGGDPVSDPIISITSGRQSLSVVMTDEDCEQVIKDLTLWLSTKPYVVIDTWGILDDGTQRLIGRFGTEREASEFIETQPEYLTGRYALDGPADDW